jgi:phosphoglycolate phosphatase
MKYTNILFDLDGTLTDPKEGIINSVKFALAKMGVNESEVGDLMKFIGPPLHVSFRDFCGFNEENSELAVQYFREYFTDKGINENRIFPGVVELLESLKSRNLKLFIATSKPTVHAGTVLDNFGITKYFQYVKGSNLNGTESGKTEIISHIIEKFKLEKDKTVMIGDRFYDIIGAKENGIDSIGVTFGYGGETELKEAGATYICRDIKDINNLLLRGNQ